MKQQAKLKAVRNIVTELAVYVHRTGCGLEQVWESQEGLPRGHALCVSITKATEQLRALEGAMNDVWLGLEVLEGKIR